MSTEESGGAGETGFDFNKAEIKKNETPWDRLPTAREAAEHVKDMDGGAEYESEEAKDLHKHCMSFYVGEVRRQAENRAEMATDEDMFDNLQWVEADKRIIEERGQVATVYNVISTAVNWIIGTEKRSRVDFKILPRRKDASKPAERKTQLLKYLSDVNRSPFSRSDAFEDTTKVGVGWLEAGVQDDDEGEPIYDAYVPWRHMFWDSASTAKDMSDCRYMFRVKWVDLDVAQAMFPLRADHLAEVAKSTYDFAYDAYYGDAALDEKEHEATYLAASGDVTATRRKRVRLIEMWWRRPTTVKKLRGGEFSSEIYDEAHSGHKESVERGEADLVERPTLRMHVAIMTTKGLLFASQSPYRHNRFPFTPIWGYRRGRDGMPYGIIRGVRDIQRDVNKRASKALHILSTNKIIMDENAVDDLDEFREEIARPDAIIVKKTGKEITINADRDLAPAHLELMSRGIEMIQQVSGVTDENMGRRSNATSGIAIQARQNQGSLANASFFENLRFANQIHGENMLSLVEQFMTDEKAFRITNMRGSPEYVTVNDGLPENDIIRTKADFIISEDDWRATVRQAQTAELLDLLKQIAPAAPQVALIMLDLLVEAMDVPNRDELVRRIRQVTGMRDPDAEEPTPEEKARAAQQAKQAAMQEAMLQAQIADKQAGAQHKQAQAQRLLAELQKVFADIASTNVASQGGAIDAAIKLTGVPAAAQVADGLLHEAGFKGRSENEEDQMMQDAIAQRQQEAAAQAQAQQQAEQQQQPQQQQPMPPRQGAI